MNPIHLYELFHREMYSETYVLRPWTELDDLEKLLGENSVGLYKESGD